MHSAKFILIISFILLISGCRNNDKIVENERNNGTNSSSSSNKTIDELYFVGMISKAPGIYKFISKNQAPGKRDKNIIKFWTKKTEKVIKLSYSPDKKSIFFLTAEDFGKKAVIPYVIEVKLYKIDRDSSKVYFIKKIGSGLQVFTIWGQDKTFRIFLNSFDRNSADFVNQQISIFDGTGKEVSTNSKKFNILKQGYPQIEESLGITSSPGSKYSIFEVDSPKTAIYLQSNSDGKAEQITSTNQKLKQADWSPDEKYVIFSTANSPGNNKAASGSSPGNSKYFIYSIKDKSIKSLNISGAKNFIVIGGVIIFDKGYQQSSFIEIINIKTRERVYSIHLPGGCGLKNIL